MRIRTKFLWSAAAAMLSCAPTLRAQNLSTQDRQFLENAGKGGTHEVHMGNLGIERGQSKAVKSFAQRLVTDHTKANGKLEALANRKGVTILARTPKW